MKKVKVTFAIAAVLCALGTTYAANQQKARAIDCSTNPSGTPLNWDSADCDGTNTVCCYAPDQTPLNLGNRTF